MSSTDQPKVYLARPIKLNLKGLRLVGSLSKYSEDIKNLENQGKLLAGSSVFWVDGDLFILDFGEYVSVSMTNNVLDMDTLDTESGQIFSESVFGKSSWELDLELPDNLLSLTGKDSLIYCLQEKCGIGTPNYKHSFAFFDPANKTLVRGDGYIMSTRQYIDHIDRSCLSVNIQGISELTQEML